ncbi:DnaD domain protein [Staphylococcus pseudintermedius]|nr:DnaD domain protein [Staphylococcus pseudintermedius]
MTNFKKISASEFETSRFYQLPKFLFEDEYFSKMSTEAKVMYALLKDRFELSRANNWIDEESNIYLLYTNKQLCKILQFGEQKIIKLKKELVKFNLLSQERVGLNKPNRLYLLKPKYNLEDTNDKELPNSQFQNFRIHSSRTSEFTVPELPNSQSNDTDFNDTDFNDTDFSDTTTTKNKKQSGSSMKNIIESEFGIKITERYMNKILKLSKDMEKDLLLYAVNYASENGNFPKQYLLKILEIWKENNISSKNQAEKFKLNRKEKNFSDNREREPRWITHPEEYKLKEEDQQKLEEDVKAFKEHLSKKQRYSN